MTNSLYVLAAAALGWVGFLIVAWLRWRREAHWQRLAEDEAKLYPVRMSYHEAIQRYGCPISELDAHAKREGWEPLHHHAGYGRKKGNRRVVR